MSGKNARLTAAVETYFGDLGRLRASGGATGERSTYPPLTALLNAVGATLKPKVFCVSELADHGAGHPDLGLYAARQVQRGRVREGQIPERGVIEVKSADDDAWLTADSDQVSRYWGRYRLVLVTNTRDFVLVGEDADGLPAKLESFRLAGSAQEFDRLLQTPRAFARRVGAGLGEYLCRALSHRAALAEPKDLAWLLASYARDGLARVEAAGDAPSLAAVRSALEQALGVRFEGERGAAFFRSTLVQTLFYGVFSAWVLWARRMPPPTGSFNWHEAVWHLRAPVLRVLFQQLSDPGRLQPLGLVEVLDWTAAALDRVDQTAFFNRFNEGEAVPYFYEPFLQAFDPALRKQLGVWYTPTEVAHLQVGLTMQALDAPLADDADERAGVFLTNALTGWEPTVQKPLPFPELEEERDRAQRVKQDTPVLVILGNPPYNGFAGMAVDEERELSRAYRTTRRVRRPEGQGLNDLYVRFFRMAERRIVEKTGQGVVCFISNYSWLDGLSFTGMRERYLEAFDAVRIDNLNGDKYRTGKIAPDGSPDPSIFSTREDPVGIQVGTAIATLVRRADHAPAANVEFRNLWGQAKREELLDTAQAEPDELYDSFEPLLPLGLPFARTAVSPDWFDWPALPDLFPKSFPGVKTNRDAFLVDIDIDRLKERVADYFDRDLSHGEIARRYPNAMKNTTTVRLSARAIRNALLTRGGPTGVGFLRYTYRPFDNRWLYYEENPGLVAYPSVNYRVHVFNSNLWLTIPQKQRRYWSPPPVTSIIGDINHMDGSAAYVPTWLHEDGLGTDEDGSRHRPNLSSAARRYLDALGMGVEDLFHHVLAVLHDPAYRQANAGALRMEWPRIPLPGWPNCDSAGASDDLAASAARGRELARLLDPETPVPRRHHRRAAPRDRRHRRALHHRRQQHVRRRLRVDRRLGALRRGPGRHARPGPRHPTPLLIRRT